MTERVVTSIVGSNEKEKLGMRREEYGDYFSEKDKWEADVCPYCGKKLESYSNVRDWWEQLLICHDCKIAIDVSR
jgi:hypothetical protein